jgi:sulfhydrogenase subunit beta (sulfur reductase)
VSLKILPKTKLTPFVSGLMADYRLCGPVHHNGGVAFQVINDPEELQMKYPNTILPPKKFLLPPKETLFQFSKADRGEVIPPPADPPTVIMGVHTCDLHAIQLLDRVFAAGNPDSHYIRRRSQTRIISIECLEPCYEQSFCKSMGTMTADEGYDLHFIDIGDAYAVDVGTEEGEQLLKYATTLPAETRDDERLNATLSNKWPLFPYRLDCDVSDLPSLLSMSMKSPLWEELGKRCLSCAACTNVCPTCFCFDTKDDIDLKLETGTRERNWDSCQLDEFAMVAGGHDFRKSRALRQRHRFLRKGKYILEAHGYLGCVGCGRCACACPVDITPVGVFNELYRQKEMGVR